MSTERLIRKSVLYTLVIGLAFGCSFSFIRSAKAVSAGLAVSASIMDIEIPAGSEYEGSITVFNNSTSTALPVHIDASLWNLKEDADDIEFVFAEDELNATKWFRLELSDFILEPGATRRIEYSISVPSYVSPGSHFVMMRFRPTLPEMYFEEEGPRFIPEIGTLFFIKVPLLSLDGESALYGADIISLEPGGADKISIINNFVSRANAGVFDSAVKTLIARISNTGVFHFKASGSIEIKNIFGRTVARADIPGRYLLPDRARDIDVIILPPPKIDDSTPPLIRIYKNLAYRIGNNVYFGPYSAVAALNVPENPPVVESVKFWVIPWQFWLLVSLVLFGVILVIRRWGSRIKLAAKALFGHLMERN